MYNLFFYNHAKMRLFHFVPTAGTKRPKAALLISIYQRKEMQVKNRCLVLGTPAPK